MSKEQESHSEEEKRNFIFQRGLWVPSSSLPPSTTIWSKVCQWTGFKEKKGWDWLQLLIVPIFLAAIAFFLNRQAAMRQERIAAERYQQEELAKYFDQVTKLLLENKLREAKPENEVRSILQARTLSTLRVLDVERKGLLIRFLAEAKLISVVTLKKAALEAVELDGTDLTVGACKHQGSSSQTSEFSAQVRGLGSFW